jgi:hypothetical protein
MNINFFYRTYKGDNRAARPGYYSKLLAFQSFLLAVRHVKSRRLTLVVDSEELPDGFESLAAAADAEVVFLRGIGNGASYFRTCELACDAHPSDFAYMAEDDYLYADDAFTHLESAVESLPEVDYFSLYDHPDLYRRRGDWPPRPRNPILLSTGRHWRVTDATCMTFGARVGVLQADLGTHRFHTVNKLNYPHDRRMWRTLLSPLRLALLKKRRLLVTPIPSLATHLQSNVLAPLVDWGSLAEEVRLRAESGVLGAPTGSMSSR